MDHFLAAPASPSTGNAPTGRKPEAQSGIGQQLPATACFSSGDVNLQNRIKLG
jgi:hypothetical protein